MLDDHEKMELKFQLIPGPTTAKKSEVHARLVRYTRMPHENEPIQGYGLDPDMVHWAIEGLKKLKPNEPIPYKKAAELGKHGEYGRGRKSSHGNSKREHGTVAYLLARMKRDFENGQKKEISQTAST